MFTLISSLAGWIGMLLILTAYWLITTNRVGGGSRLYQFLNLFGALGIIANTYFQKAWPAMTLNLAWALIALATLYKIQQRRKTKLKD